MGSLPLEPPGKRLEEEIGTSFKEITQEYVSKEVAPPTPTPAKANRGASAKAPTVAAVKNNRGRPVWLEQREQGGEGEMENN